MITNTQQEEGEEGVHVTEPTVAERLIDLADMVLEDKSQIICMNVERSLPDDVFFARVALALALKRDKGVTFGAIMGDWDGKRIVRELY